ncbi:phosphoenolpyruvate phosphomutase [Chryseobacterium pennae]|uniref:Phosphoenolpyruvate phosphomutase n=1 Tax=Chryseobacterium pennae TaxID=2258962 RepID=A0A3D9C779_9FLAO|nr:isocitrate lyase/phosphoenolpyruvate mutase family protein [Chryseobacterium pennae]REC61341.1 phosphoenolpyruvate phosphomutase [Chryseobacterium pennae]
MNILKEKLRRREKFFLGGAHDVLSSKIIENSGFDGVWLSGLGVSVTKKGLPDASIITPTEVGEICFNITSSTDIPVIIDMDSGYGNSTNAYYYAREFEKCGAMGVCVEDNIFPKCNSFYNAENKALESIDSMVGKIKAIRSAVSEDFCVIARCEGLIVGLPKEEVQKRCIAYVNAGADALVIHTSDWNKLIDFLDTWDGDIPLVVIPTKIPEVSQKTLLKYFDIIIYANQLLRASIKASELVMRKILNEGLSLEVESSISSMEEVFVYNQMAQLTELENEYLK